MASIPAKKPCSKCQKGAGVTTCDGCQQSFCIKHIIEHRQELATQMDNIGQEHDSIRRDLIQEDLRHPLLLRIDEWEQKSIEKIQQAADDVRKQLLTVSDKHSTNTANLFDTFTEELISARQTYDLTETNLEVWSAKL